MTAAEGKNPQNSTQTQPKLRWIRRLSRQLPDELHIMSTKKTSTSAFSAAGPWVRDNLPTDLGQPDLSYSAVSCSRWRHVDLISGTTAERESSFKCNLEIPSLACYVIAKNVTMTTNRFRLCIFDNIRNRTLQSCCFRRRVNYNELNE